MSTISFSKSAPADAEDKDKSVPQPPAQTEPARAPAEQTLAVREERQLSTPAGNDFSGNWDRDDQRLPRLNLVHKTSAAEAIEKFGIGSFSFAKEVKLSDGKTPLPVTALHAFKDYVQKLPYGSPQMPLVFKTPDEVTQAGGSLNNKDRDTGNFFQARAHLQLIFSAPEGASDADLALFPYDFGGKEYAMALLTVSSSAYTTTARELATLCQHNKVMRQGMHYGALHLTSELRKDTKNTWHVPVLKFVGQNPPDLLEFFASLKG